MIRFGRDSKTPVAVQNGTCLACHEKSMSASWHAGPHDANNVSCASCHDSHVSKDPVLSARTQADVCYTCHVAQRGEFLKPYAHPVKQGKIACSDCHQPHGSTSEAQLVKATVNQTCYQCHAEKRGPFLWEHAPVPEDCSNCHAPHGSSNPGMLIARGPLLCQSCHSQQGHPSLSYGPSGLPGGTGPTTSTLVLGNCMNCHSQVHGSNHPSGCVAYTVNPMHTRSLLLSLAVASCLATAGRRRRTGRSEHRRMDLLEVPVPEGLPGRCDARRRLPRRVVGEVRPVHRPRRQGRLRGRGRGGQLHRRVRLRAVLRADRPRPRTRARSTSRAAGRAPTSSACTTTACRCPSGTRRRRRSATSAAGT